MGDYDIDGCWNPQLPSIGEIPDRSEAVRDGLSEYEVNLVYDRMANLERQLAEKERALNAYKARDGECPSWLRPGVTDEQIDKAVEWVMRESYDTLSAEYEACRCFVIGIISAALEAGEDE